MKKGLIFLNLGTPLDPSVKQVRAYLREFLMDPFVLDIPTPLRWLLVNGIIAPFRAPRSAHAYQSIWTADGSPLLVYTKRFLEKMKRQVSDEWLVEAGMTYGSPSFEEALHKVSKAGVSELYVVPLFPQWATAAGGAAIYGFKKVLKKNNYQGKVMFLKDYHNSADYISALASSVHRFESQSTIKPHYLLSYHSLPERQDIGGVYRSQCYKTSELLAKELNWKENKIANDQKVIGDYTVSFQSRLGRAKWIQPYTADMLKQLAQRGVKDLAVMCPGFAADCLETLEEINIGGREIFMANGGQSFTMIPCLNDDDVWIQKCEAMLDDHNLTWTS